MNARFRCAKFKKQTLLLNRQIEEDRSDEESGSGDKVCEMKKNKTIPSENCKEEKEINIFLTKMNRYRGREREREFRD